MLVSLPPWIDAESWDAFVEMRKAKGKRAPFTERAAKMVIRELDRLRSQGHNPSEVLDQSTMNGWSGVFPLKAMEGVTADGSKRYEKTQEHMRKMREGAARPSEEILRRLREMRH